MAAVMTSLASEGTSSPSPQHSALTFTDLFHQLDARLPQGDYRIPGLVSTPKGTLLVFVMGRFHRTDVTPNIVYADPPCAIHNPQFASRTNVVSHVHAAHMCCAEPRERVRLARQEQWRIVCGDSAL